MPKTSLIAGSSKLDQLLAEPFQTFYASLVRHPRLADAILVGGYGFGDTHVNEALSHCLPAAKTLLPVMVLEYAGPNTNPMESRQDDGSFGLYWTLNAAATDFREPGHLALSDIENLVLHSGFEVNRPAKIAIWHSGFTSSACRADAIVSWLTQAKDDTVLASI